MHGHHEHTIGDYSDIVQCVPRHLQMFTFYNICRLAVLPLSQWPSSCSGKTFSRAILHKISQYVHEEFFPIVSQKMIIISSPACRGLGSSICQITAGQVAAQFSLNFTLSFTSTGAQLSQLQGSDMLKVTVPLKKYLFLKDISVCFLPDRDICEFFWSNCDAFCSKIKCSPFSEPRCFPHNDNIFENIKRIWEAAFFNDMGFIICAVSAFTPVSTCAQKKKYVNKCML